MQWNCLHFDVYTLKQAPIAMNKAEHIIHFIKNYIFLLILTEDDRGRFEVSNTKLFTFCDINILGSADCSE